MSSNYRLYYKKDFRGQYNNGMQIELGAYLQLPFENLGGVMMTRGMSNVVKGIAAGMLVGTAAYVACLLYTSTSLDSAISPSALRLWGR